MRDALLLDARSVAVIPLRVIMATGLDLRTQTITGEAGGAPPVRAVGIQITVLRGPDAGRAGVIASDRCTIGRAKACDFALSDPTVSLFHAELHATPRGEFEVRDHQSRNGTWHGSARFRDATVASGTSLTLGSTTLRVDLVDRDAATSPPSPKRRSFGRLCGSGPVMQQVFDLLERVAPTELSVLIEGPTGTGKELTAEAIHKTSGRRGPFVPLDCTSIPPSLAEATLFGHERGAFTGAVDARPGPFEVADGGTLFLDEIGELLPELQPKLLRVLERHPVQRVGSARAQGKAVNVRVVCATHRDLRAMINQGKFREDLYQRLAQVRVALPPLGEHRDDIPELVAEFLRQIKPDVPGARKISMSALAELVERDYPGNVRELKNTVERAAALARGSEITVDDLAFGNSLNTRPDASPVSGSRFSPDTPYKDVKRAVLDDLERAYFSELMQRAKNNLSLAARVAHLDRNHIREILLKHGLLQSNEP